MKTGQLVKPRAQTEKEMQHLAITLQRTGKNLVPQADLTLQFSFDVSINELYILHYFLCAM